MIVLSRLELQPRHLGVIRDLADVAEMHRTIMRAFPQSDGRSPRAELGVLFRIELGESGARILVQSRVQPDWSLLPDEYLVGAEAKEIGQALASISDRRELRFLLVANPSRKVARDDHGRSRHSRRVALTTDDARHRWLVDRGMRDGFALSGSGPHDGVRIDRVIAPPPVRGAGRSKITVKAVRYEGRLTVSDAAMLVRAIKDGLGPAKAYGCGLLSVAPV